MQLTISEQITFSFWLEVSMNTLFIIFIEEGVSGKACGITFCEDMPDILPLTAGTCSAVGGDREDTPVSTLFGQHPVSHIVLAQHLDVDSQFCDIISGENILHGVVDLSGETGKTDVQETHPAVRGGVLPELLLVVGSYQGFGWTRSWSCRSSWSACSYLTMF